MFNVLILDLLVNTFLTERRKNVTKMNFKIFEYIFMIETELMQ